MLKGEKGFYVNYTVIFWCEHSNTYRGYKIKKMKTIINEQTPTETRCEKLLTSGAMTFHKLGKKIRTLAI